MLNPIGCVRIYVGVNCDDVKCTAMVVILVEIVVLIVFWYFFDVVKLGLCIGSWECKNRGWYLFCTF